MESLAGREVRETPAVLTTSLRSHRWGGAAALGIAAVVGGGGAGLATVESYADETIEQYQVDATLDDDTLSVVETIDYDFGSDKRHGIFREVDLGVVDRTQSVVLENATAASDSAPDDLQVTDSYLDTSLRVGNPDETVTGLHRYQLSYDLVGVPDPQEEGRLVFVAVGDRWEVPIGGVTVRVAPDFEPGEVTCSVGQTGAFERCDATVGDDGVVTATADHLDAGQGLVLSIEAGAARTPAVLAAPSLDLDESGDPWVGASLATGGVAAAFSVVGSLLGGRWVRRAGADLTGAPANPAEAAYATADAGTGVQISDEEAAEHVTVQFAPPEGLTPAQGAVLDREKVDDAAKTAWLAQSVIDGWIGLDGDPDSPTLTHGGRATSDPAHMPAPLAAIFDGRPSLELGSYDKGFAAGWTAIGGQLEAWRRASGLWDQARWESNMRRVIVALGLGLASAVVVGLGLLAGLGHVPVIALPLVAVAGLLFGAGLRAIMGARTMAVRNPAGFGLWLRTEGFRRFLAESEGQHARWAADHNMLREYTAWAVALGELDRWNRATSRAGIPPTDPALATTAAFVGLHHSAHTTSVQPQSHGGGGGGGGGFSGGGFSGGVGGGGGGSW